MSDLDTDRSLECISLGFLYSQDDHKVTLVSHMAYPDDDKLRQGCGIMVIPRQAVLALEHLIVSDH